MENERRLHIKYISAIQARRLSSLRNSLLKNRFHLGDESRVKAPEMSEDFTIAPDDQRLRDAVAPPHYPDLHLLVSPTDRVVDVERFGKVFHRLGMDLRVLVRQPDHLDAPALIFFGDLDQMRNLLTARAAPCGPQIHDQNLSRIIGEFRLLAVEQVDARLHYVLGQRRDGTFRAVRRRS